MAVSARLFRLMRARVRCASRIASNYRAGRPTGYLTERLGRLQSTTEAEGYRTRDIVTAYEMAIVARELAAPPR